MRDIVYDTCDHMWELLKETELPPMTDCAFKKVSSDFKNRWNFPHCIGAIDGKHIKLECPPKSGNAYFNYKKTFSIVLQGVTDANANFIAVDVGDYGRHSDGGVLKHSSFGRALLSDQLPIPKDDIIEGETLPYVFLGDEAYPLKRYLMRPYPSRGLDNTRRVFNYRHSRARRIVECAFGILSSKWSILKNTMNINPENVSKIVLACCVLHNFVRKRDGIMAEDSESNCAERPLQQSGAGTATTHLTGRPTQEAMEVRDKFSRLFMTNLSVPWQYESAHIPEPNT